jgi:uridine kinase
MGSLLIQQDDQSGEPLLFNASLPPILKTRSTAAKTYVLLSDSQIGTAAAIIMAIRVLLDHGVREEQ